MQQLDPLKPGGKSGKKMSWIIALFAALFIIWVIYTGFQTQQADSRSMPANMPGMNSTSTEATPTEMSGSMPGMNHP